MGQIKKFFTRERNFNPFFKDSFPPYNWEAIGLGMRENPLKKIGVGGEGFFVLPQAWPERGPQSHLETFFFWGTRVRGGGKEFPGGIN